MAKQEIWEKLNDILAQEIVNEYQVVYILSRIRKYLEKLSLEGAGQTYPFVIGLCMRKLTTQKV
jgi:hypothetical protein